MQKPGRRDQDVLQAALTQGSCDFSDVKYIHQRYPSPGLEYAHDFLYSLAATPSTLDVMNREAGNHLE